MIIDAEKVQFQQQSQSCCKILYSKSPAITIQSLLPFAPPYYQRVQVFFSDQGLAQFQLDKISVVLADSPKAAMMREKLAYPAEYGKGIPCLHDIFDSVFYGFDEV